MKILARVMERSYYPLRNEILQNGELTKKVGESQQSLVRIKTGITGTSSVPARSQNLRTVSGSISSPIPLRLIRKYLRVTFYVGVCPFQFKFDSTTRQFQVHRNYIQVACCAMLIMFGVLTRIRGVRDLKVFVPVVGTDRNPIEYFDAAEQISLLFYYCAVVITFWFRSEEFVRILNLLFKVEERQKKRFKRRNLPGGPHFIPGASAVLGRSSFFQRYQITIWLFMWGMYCTFSYLTTIAIYLEDSGEDLNVMIQTMRDEGRSLVFFPFQDRTTTPQPEPNAETLNETTTTMANAIVTTIGKVITLHNGDGSNATANATTMATTLTPMLVAQSTARRLLDLGFILVHAVSCFGENLLMTSGDMLLIFSAIALFNFLKTFCSNLASPNFYMTRVVTHDDDNLPIMTINMNTILEDFDQIRHVVKQMNSAIGLLTFSLTLGSLPFFITYFLKMLSPQSVWLFLKIFIYFAVLLIFVGIAAKVNKKAQYLEDWLSSRRNYYKVKTSQPKIFGVPEMMAIQYGKNIGISAGGFFVITTEFLGAWISLMLTFAIIMVELRPS